MKPPYSVKALLLCLLLQPLVLAADNDKRSTSEIMESILESTGNRFIVKKGKDKRTKKYTLIYNGSYIGITVNTRANVCFINRAISNKKGTFGPIVLTDYKCDGTLDKTIGMVNKESKKTESLPITAASLGIYKNSLIMLEKSLKLKGKEKIPQETIKLTNEISNLSSQLFPFIKNKEVSFLISEGDSKRILMFEKDNNGCHLTLSSDVIKTDNHILIITDPECDGDPDQLLTLANGDASHLKDEDKERIYLYNNLLKFVLLHTMHAVEFIEFDKIDFKHFKEKPNEK